MLKLQKGFTAIELAIVVGFLGSIAATGGVIYVVLHFASKFW